MTTIKATCPVCGEVTVTPADIELRVFPDGSGESYAFDCPECGARVRKPADARVVRLLNTGGVEAVTAQTHPERPDPSLGPITHDELLDFHQLLQRDDWIDAVLGANHS